MLAISNTFDTASIHAAGSTSLMCAWCVLDERLSSQVVEPASSCKRGIMYCSFIACTCVKHYSLLLCLAWPCGISASDPRSKARGFDSSWPASCHVSWQVVHTRVSVTKQCNSVSAKGRWCFAAGKVIAGLAESNGNLSSGLMTTLPSGSLPGISSGPFARKRVLDWLGLPLSFKHDRFVSAILFVSFRSVLIAVLLLS